MQLYKKANNPSLEKDDMLLQYEDGRRTRLRAGFKVMFLLGQGNAYVTIQDHEGHNLEFVRHSGLDSGRAEVPVHYPPYAFELRCSDATRIIHLVVACCHLQAAEESRDEKEGTITYRLEKVARS